jgi:hypothetical protein
VKGGEGVDVYVQSFLTLTLYECDWLPHALAALPIQKVSQVLIEYKVVRTVRHYVFTYQQL